MTMNLRSVIFIILPTFIYSCKTDEFRFSELTIKDDFKTDMIAPLFSGDLEFKDFIYWEGYETSPVGNADAVLKFSDGKTVNIPAKIIFEPHIVVKEFPFSIQGSYELAKISLIFRVSNGTPFPFNLKLRFFEKTTPAALGPPIQPDSFKEGDLTENSLVPVLSADTLLLTEEQRQSFMSGNRIQLTTWFENSGFLTGNDTLNAHYPIGISVILFGEIKAKNEDN